MVVVVVVVTRVRRLPVGGKGGDSPTAVDHPQPGIACRLKQAGQKRLHTQAVLHQHAGLPQGRQIGRPGLHIVGPLLRRYQSRDRGAVSRHRPGEQGDRKKRGDNVKPLA